MGPVAVWVGEGTAPGAAQGYLQEVQRQLPGSEPFLCVETGYELRRKLRELRARGFVIAGLPPNEFLSLSSSQRELLTDALRAGCPQFGSLCGDGGFVAADRKQVASDLLGALGAPYAAWRTVLSLIHSQRREGDPILSFGGKVNDFMVYLTRARWMRRTGALGVATNCYLGHAGALVYPPLGPWLLGKLGLRYLTLVVLLLVLTGLVLLGVWQHSLWTILLAPFVLGNRALLDALLRIGRIELLAWMFVVLAAVMVASGAGVLAGVMIAAAMLVAPLPAMIGAVSLTGCLFHDRFLGWDLWLFLAVVVPAALSWWLPFLSHGRHRVGFQRLREAIPEWYEGNVGKLTRRARVLLPVAAVFALVALFFGGAGVTVVVPGMGMLLAISGVILVRKSYLLHPATLDAAFLVVATFTLAWSSGILTPLAFLGLLWFLHRVESPVHDSAGYVRPAYFAKQVHTFRHVMAKQPESRVALEFCGWRNGLNWLLAYALADQDRVELLSGVAYDQVEFELPFEYEQHMNLADGVGALLDRMDRVGADSLLCYTPELVGELRSAGFTERASARLDGFDEHGFFQRGRQFQLVLLQAPGEITRISPPVPLHREPNKISFVARGGQRYLLKYAWHAGWNATDADGNSLMLEDARPGIWVTVPRDTTVTLRYRWRNYYFK